MLEDIELSRWVFFATGNMPNRKKVRLRTNKQTNAYDTTKGKIGNFYSSLFMLGI